MIGNKDPITGQDTLYHQFYVTLKGGNYNLRMGTYYSNIGTSPYKIYNFNVITPQIIDNSPPIISSFTASPSKVTGIRNILLNANYHSKSGISKAEVIWYNNGEYDFVMVGGSIVISSDTLACGNNNIVLKITGGNGKTAISNINIDKTCIKKKQIIKKKVIKKTVKNITITQNTTTINTTTINTTANITNTNSSINKNNKKKVIKKKANNNKGLNKLNSFITKNWKILFVVSIGTFILFMSLIYMFIILEFERKRRN